MGSVVAGADVTPGDQRWPWWPVMLQQPLHVDEDSLSSYVIGVFVEIDAWLLGM